MIDPEKFAEASRKAAIEINRIAKQVGDRLESAAVVADALNPWLQDYQCHLTRQREIAHLRVKRFWLGLTWREGRRLRK